MLKKLFGFGRKKEEKDLQAIEPLENENFSEEESSEIESEYSQIIQESHDVKKCSDSEDENINEPKNHVYDENVSEIVAEGMDGEAFSKEPEEEPETKEDIEEAVQVVEETELVEETKELSKDFQEESLVEEIPSETIEEESVSQGQELSEDIGFFAKIKKGLEKTTKNFSKKLDELFSGYSKIDEEIFEELEELLVLGDLGFETAIAVTEELRKRAQEKKIEEVSDLEQELENIIEEILTASEKQNISGQEYPQIMVIVGVNGVGKTTSIGKIASQLKREGKSVMLAAGDTFRAAAADQLTIWADRADVPIVRSNEGADPSAVIFDAIKSAQAKKIDVLICDTAGRLHNKKNLMQELEKIFRIVNREYPEAKKEVFLVIDATTGQNAVNQAKTFSEVAPLTGIVLTKLDGTAKGGVVIGLSKELQIPIRYVGVGEKIDDLQKFDAKDFARALFTKNH